MTSAVLEESTSAENGRRPGNWLKRLFDRWGLFPESDEDSAANWERYMPLSVADAVAMLKRDLPEDTEVILTVKEDGTGSIGIRADGAIDESQEFDLKQRKIGDGEMVIEDQGKGLGRTIMRNEIELFRACGFGAFNIHAGFEAGGYTWARLGFLPNSVARPRLHEPVTQRYAAVRDLLEAHDRNLLDKVAALREPKDCWVLANADVDIAPQLRALAQGSGAEQDRYHGILNLVRKTSGDDGVKVLADMRHRLETGQNLYLGRFLLAGSDWPGHLDFNDPAQMERVGQYVGGWTAPKPP